MNWKPINRKRLPKTGRIIAGSWRNNILKPGGWEWSISGVTDCGWATWIDSDRTHYIRLPKPPKR
jgi:hypothetical protein